MIDGLREARMALDKYQTEAPDDGSIAEAERKIDALTRLLERFADAQVIDS